MSDIENVKKLREATGAGFKDCNLAIKESGGDIDKAIEILRVKGISKASKKMSRDAKEGVVAVSGNESKTSVIEVNCETDFVAKNEDFTDFVKELSELNNEKNSNLNDLKSSKMKNGETVEDNVVSLIAKIGEKITIGKAKTIENAGSVNNHYLHTVVKDNISKLAVIVSIETKDNSDAIKIFGDDKGDHRILNAALHIQAKYPNRQVIMVSKDINLRIKAKSLNIIAEDYETGKLNDSDIEADTAPTGRSVIEDVEIAFIDSLYANDEVANNGVIDKEIKGNQFFTLRNGKKSVLTYFNKTRNSFARIEKMNCFGIKPKNAEQAFAMHALTNPEVKLVTIQGVAGTGKTLLSLATALAQHRDYHSIFLARPIVPLSNRDIGYLPGDAETKLNPYMEPLWDNLTFIKNQFSFD